MIRQQIREVAVAYAKSFIGTPYEWGGDNPDGLDCSGFLGVVYRGIGLLKNKEDLTSRGFYYKFKDYEVTAPQPGAFVVYGKDINSISHIALLIDESHIIEAGGGNSKTTTKKVADDRNAFVRMRPYKYRIPLAICDPIKGLQ